MGLFSDAPPQVITGILGVLKAGAVFVPLDPTFPVQRLQVMSEQVELEWYVSGGQHLEKLGQLRGAAEHQARVIKLDENGLGAVSGLEVLESYSGYERSEAAGISE